MPDLEARLGELRFADNTTAAERLKIIDSTIEEFSTGLPQGSKEALHDNIDVRNFTDYVFSERNDTVTSILQSLSELEQGQIGQSRPDLREWMTKTRQAIEERCPTSVAVALEQLIRGQKWDIAQTFKREHQIASRFMSHPDFVTGVKSVIIDKVKGRPNWQPASHEDVKEKDVDEFFPEQQSQLELNEHSAVPNYFEYPWRTIGLPSEDEVRAYIRGENERSDGPRRATPKRTRAQVIDHFLEIRRSKIGTLEKVEDILNRKTKVTEEGFVVW